MRIGILSQWYDPETGPASLPGIYAREFVAAGHEVVVLTGFPNYPEGRIYEGYRQRLRFRQNLDGVEVVRVPLVVSHSRSAVGRALNYLSFALSASFFGAGVLRGVDAIWVYNSPVTVALPLFLHSHGGRTPYFLHVQDLWPDSLIESGMLPQGRLGGMIAALARRTVRLMERRAASIGVIAPGVRRIILARDPSIDGRSVLFAPNPADESLFAPARRHDRDRGHPFVLMYAGAIGDVQGLDAVLDAAAILRARGIVVEMRFFGDGIARQRLEERTRAEDLGPVSFEGRIPSERVREEMARADAHLVALADSPFLDVTMPSKIANLLASAVPILGVVRGDPAQVLRESGAATIADPGSAVSIAAALSELISMTEDDRQAFGESGRRYYDTYFAAAAAAARVLDAMTRSIRRPLPLDPEPGEAT